MFPLGSVLFPDGVLPLHIFEIRYQQMLNHCLESDRRFGVVLITRGSEVGGGEERSTIGTIAHIQEHQRFDDGRAAVVSNGIGRFEVDEWLADDPYPRALVRELPVEPVGPDDQRLFDAARQRFDDVIRLGHELGRLASAPRSDWHNDLEAATWQIAGRSPCTPLDQQRILSSATRADRLRIIDGLLADVYTDLELMGGLDQGPNPSDGRP